MAIEQVKDKTGRLLVPKEFTNVSTTPLEVNTDNAPFDIKVPKPTPAR